MHPYATKTYAQALQAQGQALELPATHAFVLSRPIAGSSYRDLQGPYPRLAVPEPGLLKQDLLALGDGNHVSFVAVTDALASADLAPPEFAGMFERCIAFKQHQVLDRSQPFSYDRHHRYEVRRGRRLCEVSRLDYHEGLAVWNSLYAELILRHAVTGPANFSADYFGLLADLPGLELWVAKVEGEVVAGQLWIVHEGLAYYHLSASYLAGYKHSAAYAIIDCVLEAHPEIKLVDFGANAGNSSEADGLFRFKAGFANQTRPAYLLGQVLNGPAYAELSAGKSAGGFFPAYRAA
ncbi:GNAT family N-acetyltransferase [Chitinimonas naiadis]